MSVAARWMPAWVVAIALVVAAATPRNSSEALLLVLMLTAPIVVTLFRAGGSRPKKDVLLPLALVSLVPVAMTVAALMSSNRYVGLVGRVQQHNGAMTWIGLFGLVAVMAVMPRPGDLERMLKACSVGSAVVAIGVVLDAVGVDFGSQFSPEASGFMTSSQLAGQVLVLGLCTALAWALVPGRSGNERIAATSASLLSVTGLVAADARSAIAAVVVAVAGMAVLGWSGRKKPVAPGVFAGVAVATLATVTGGLSAAAVAGVSSSWWASVNNALSDRLVVWRAATLSAIARPLLGRGPDQFDAVLSWDAASGALARMIVTHDAHNMLLTMAATGGLVAVVAFLVAFFAGANALGASLVRSRYSTPVLALAAGLVAWFVTVQFAWVSVLGGMLAALLFGAVLGAGGAQNGDPQPLTVPVAASIAWIAMGIAFAVFAGKGLAAEVRWALPSTPDDLYTSALIAMESPDPTYAEDMLQKVSAASIDLRDAKAVAALGPLANKVSVDAGWSVMGARAVTDYEMLKVAVGEAAPESLYAVVDRSRAADRTSGVWDYLGAVGASRFGDKGAAARYAKAALTFRVGPGARTWLETVAVQK